MTENVTTTYVSFSTAKPNPQLFEVKDIDPYELWEKRDQVAIIDVRQPEEFTGELGHIPGAQLIVLDTLPEQISRIPKDKTIVFICRSGTRSARASSWAISMGLPPSYNLTGGMILWNKLNLQVVR